MAAVVITLFVSSTASLALQLAHVMQGYSFLIAARPDDFQLERNKIDVAKVCSSYFFGPWLLIFLLLYQMALVVVVTMIADGVLVRSRRNVIPGNSNTWRL
jgi:hypothetical protein